MTPEETKAQKEVGFYASSVDAWFNTSLERDKSVLALSAGGIGLLVTLLTTVGLSSAGALVLYVGALFCFVIATGAVLTIFSRNRDHVEEVIAGRAVGRDRTLDRLDAVAMWAFGLGVVAAAAIGVQAAIHSYQEKSMPSEPLSKVNAPVDMTKSFSGMAGLQPSPSATPGAGQSQGAGGGSPAASPAAPASNQGQGGGK